MVVGVYQKDFLLSRLTRIHHHHSKINRCIHNGSIAFARQLQSSIIYLS